MKNPSTKNLAVFSFLLPSLTRTVDCGYRYLFVLGYDKGDPYFDNAAVSNAITLLLLCIYAH